MKKYIYDIMFHGIHLNFTEDQQWLDNDTFCVDADDDQGNKYMVYYDGSNIEVGEEDLIDWESPKYVFTADGEEI